MSAKIIVLPYAAREAPDAWTTLAAFTPLAIAIAITDAMLPAKTAKVIAFPANGRQSR